MTTTACVDTMSDMTRTLTPAYGRDYKSAAAVKADWNAGKDFMDASFDMPRPLACNRESFPTGTRVGIRYARLTKQVFVTVDHVDPRD